MHPGPMNRGMEIAAEVADSRAAHDRRAGRQRRDRPDGRAVPAARRRGGACGDAGDLPDHERAWLIKGAAHRSAASRRTSCSRTGSSPRSAPDLTRRRGVARRGRPGRAARPGRPAHPPARAGPGGRRDGRDRHPGRRARRVHRRARDGQHRAGRRHRRRGRAGLAARPRGRATCDVRPVGAVTVGLAGEQLAELGAMADSAARVRVFSDDGYCVADPLLMRRALEYVKAFDGVIAQHAQEPRLTEGAQMNEGEVAARLGLAGWPAAAEEAIIARDCLLAAHVGSPPARLPRVHGRARWRSSAGPSRRAGGSPPRSPRTTCCSPTTWPRLRPGLQGQPAAAHRRRRRGAAGGAGRRHDRLRRHRPRPAPGRGQGDRVGRRGQRHDRPGDRAARSCSAAMVDTGLLDWAGVADRMSARPRGHRPRPRARPAARPRARPPTSRCTTPPPAARRWTRPRTPPRAATARSPGWRCPAGVHATFLRGTATVLDGKVTR